MGKKLETLKDNWKKFIDETEKSDDYDKGVWYENPYNPSDPDGENKNPRVLMDSYADHDEDNIENFPIRTPESLREVEIQIDMEYAS